MKACTGGAQLVRKIAEGKTSHELSWKVKVMIKKKKKVCHSASAASPCVSSLFSFRYGLFGFIVINSVINSVL